MSKKIFAPSMDPDAREKDVINLAMNLAEKKMRDGTASSALILEFVRRGSQKEELERNKLIEENKLLRAKTEALQSAKDISALYEDAIKAMRMYSGDDE